MSCNCKRQVIQPARKKSVTKQTETVQDENTVLQNTSSEKNNNSIYQFYGM